jgi:uncharacterized membrane protein YraQ (UPF0718 family)
MKLSSDGKAGLIIVGVFLLLVFVPLPDVGEISLLMNAFWESLHLVQWYAREHVVLCLLPAFFIAGAIAVFISQGAVLKYLGVGANKVVAYGVASMSGGILAVCSCTVLPLFAGIYKMGAGLGPAATFLYAGPAVNVLAIVLTAQVLGVEIGVARAVGAVVFSVVIGLAMHFIFRKEELEKSKTLAQIPEAPVTRPLWQNALYFGSLVVILVFANWGSPSETSGLWYAVFSAKWFVTGSAAVALGVMLVFWLGAVWWHMVLVAVSVVLFAVVLPAHPTAAFGVGILGVSLVAGLREGEMKNWLGSSWGFAKQMLPLLLFGVLIAGALLGRPGHEGLIPSAWVAAAVGGNSIQSNFFAAFAGAFMYFATLTEVPILQGLLGAGMGKGPALALLLAGPALSLPNMLVIRSVMGTKKTVVFVSLTVFMATFSGILYGWLFG